MKTFIACLLRDNRTEANTYYFYDAEFVPAFTNTQGGPRRNSNSQVLDTNRKPIPRLYSAGELGAIYR